jgi:hypothetical protein
MKRMKFNRKKFKKYFVKEIRQMKRSKVRTALGIVTIVIVLVFGLGAVNRARTNLSDTYDPESILENSKSPSYEAQIYSVTSQDVKPLCNSFITIGIESILTAKLNYYLSEEELNKIAAANTPHSAELVTPNSTYTLTPDDETLFAAGNSISWIFKSIALDITVAKSLLGTQAYIKYQMNGKTYSTLPTQVKDFCAALNR